MNGTMIVIAPEGGQSLIEYNGHTPALETLQQAVGGYIELVPGFDTFSNSDGLHECVCFCNEDGKGEGLEFNKRAQICWENALRRQGRSLYDKNGQPADVLVGSIVVLFGDDEFMSEL